MTKQKGRLKYWLVAGVLAVILILAVAIAMNMPKTQQVSDSRFDLATLADGTYRGECNNGLVHAVVDVDVQNHAIAEVRLVKHRNGMGGAAEAIADDVAQNQTVELDAVSGATYSSQTILKAVENALAQ